MTSRSRSRMRAAGRELEAADHPQGGGLAAAGRPQQREELPGAHLERHAVDRPDTTEVLLQVDEADLRGRGGRHAFAEASAPCESVLGAVASRGTCERRPPPTGRSIRRPAPRDARLGRLGHQGLEVEPLHASLAGRPTQQVALAGGDPELADDRQLLAGLDALGDDRGAPARGELLQGPQDAVRRVVEDAALDQRQVDLDDVEVDLAEEPQAGVPGTHVVGGEPHPGPAAGGRVAAQLLQVLDLLALGELDDQLVGPDAAPAEDRRQLDRVELVRFEGARRDVDAQVHARLEAVDAAGDDVEAGHVELDRASGALGGGEQAVRVGHRRRRRSGGSGPRSRSARRSSSRRSAGRPGAGTARARIVPERGRQVLDRALVGQHAVATRVVGDGVRPAVPLAPVERGVGVAVEQAADRARRREGGDADRERERFGGTPRRSRRARALASIRRATVRPVSRSAFGSSTANSSPPTRNARSPRRIDRIAMRPTADEQVVARGVAAFVVDLLEVVDVDEQQGERRLVARRDARAGGAAPPGRRGGCRARSGRRAGSPRAPVRRGPAAGRDRRSGDRRRGGSGPPGGP